MKKYVLCFVIDDKNNFVGLTKNRGWDFLIGKHTFPGGKIENEEDINVASTREFEEETGVLIPLADWFLAGRKMEDGMFDLYIMAAKSNDVDKAYTKETEFVWNGNIFEHINKAKSTPDKYTSDFLEVTQICLNVLNIKGE